MNKRNRRLRSIMLVPVILIWLGFAVSLPTYDAETLDTALQKLSSSDPSVRADAFYSLFSALPDVSKSGFTPSTLTSKLLKNNPEQSERITLALIGALEKENGVVANATATNTSLSEHYTNYYADLIGAVASLKDSRTLKALLGAITTGGMATSGLANLGISAVSPVISKLRDNDADVRQGAVRTLGKLAQRQELFRSNPENIPEIRNSILSALQDPDPFVRIAAVDAAGALRGDRQIQEKLRSLSLHDTYTSPSTTREARASFPVRAAAERVLKAKEFYVMRDKTKFGCRVQSSTESPIGERFLGPFPTSEQARTAMCKTRDDTMTDTSKCWDVYPKDACNAAAHADRTSDGTVSRDVTLGTWTILIFMNGKNNLEPYAIRNFEQIASIDHPDNGVRVLVEFGRPKSNYDSRYGPWSGIKRFLVVKNTKPTEAEQIMDVGKAGLTTDMGNPKTLSDFISWGRSTYPAKHYMLIIWNHGQGWRFQEILSNQIRRRAATRAFSLSEEEDILRENPEAETVGGYRSVSYDQDTRNTLYNRDIQDVLTQNLNGQTLDVLGFDACLMSMIETGYAFRKISSAMVASEELEPANGWDYSLWLPTVTTNPNIDALGLASGIVNAYKTKYGNSDDTTLSALDLGAVDQLSSSLSDFADALSSKLSTEVENIRSARGKCAEYGRSSPTTPYVDLDRFLSLFQSSSHDTNLKTKAQAVRDKLSAVVRSNYASSSRMGNFGSSGLSIYFPATKAQFTNDRYHTGYVPGNRDHPVEFVDSQHWAPFLQKFLAMP